MRYLGIDYGTKRIGLAISDPGASIASPLTTVPVRGALDEQVRDVLAAVGDYEIGACVVGLPLNMDGSEGVQATLTRAFAARLQRVGGKPVQLWDERLSTVEAAEALSGAMTRKKRKARRDRLAAQIILKSFLEAGGAVEREAP